MPSVTFDSQSFLLDGRRIWIVSGSLCYARASREQWADRIHAAKLAGFNTIETPVVWSRHESRPGHFDFSGDNDIRTFVKLCGSSGMHVILRPGPYVGGDWDLGGIPPWVLGLKDVKLRSANAAFLEACSRYLTAVSEQVRDLQVTSVGAGGPVLLVQNEHGWTCGHDEHARGYLGELNRYLREGGITVPIIDANSLWQSVEGELDCWSGSEQMLTAMRQLSAVRPDLPRVVIDFHAGRTRTWGEGAEAGAAPDGATVVRRLAEVLAGGGQFNLQPFFGGTNFGFSAGRSARGAGAFFCGSHEQGAVVGEDGSAGSTFSEVRRIVTFASRFGRVLANRSSSYQPVTVDPSPALERQRPAAGKGRARGAGEFGAASVVHSTGSQGGVAFVFNESWGSGASEKVGERVVKLLMPDGSPLPVDLSGLPVVWCLLDTLIGGRASLDYCNLSAFASVGKVFVCFGRGGARGLLAINGSPMDVTVPAGRAPLIEELEGITVVVCNLEQIDSTFVTDTAVYVGASGLTEDGRPIVPASAGTKASYVKIDADGAVTPGTVGAGGAVKAVTPPHEPIKLGAWGGVSVEEYVGGTSARYAAIAGPAELTSLGSPFGYGWYRIVPSVASARRVTVSAPEGGDRLHVFHGGKCLGVLGVGPGASSELAIPVKKGEALVVLAENFGRYSSGSCLHDRKGLWGHLIETTALKPGKPRLVVGEPIEPLSFRVPLWDTRPGDVTLAERITWTCGAKSRGAVVMSLNEGGVLPVRGLLIVNDKPIEYVDGSGPRVVVIDGELLGRAKNTIQLAVMPDVSGEDGLVEPLGPMDEVLSAVDARVSFAESKGAATAKADWAFARWELPVAGSFHLAGRGFRAPKGGAAAGPTWWRATFSVSGSPSLWVDLSGMSKGQVYVNGRHLGRYFVSTAEGKPVGPQTKHVIPPSWLRVGENELVLFDEHSASPARVHVVHSERSAIVARV